MAGKQAKEFLLFLLVFPLWPQVTSSCLFFHAPILKGIIKQGKQNKVKTFLLFSVSLSLTDYFVLFHAPSLNVRIYQKRLMPRSSLPMSIPQAKIILLFSDCLTFTQQGLCSFFQAPDSNTKRKLHNKLLLLASFLAKAAGVLSTNTF